MRMRIGTKVYDTVTAKKIADYESSYSKRDFRYYEESLYQKKTGEYFLAGKGGPESKYREQVGISEWDNGQNIIPLTMEQAKEWLRKVAE